MKWFILILLCGTLVKCTVAENEDNINLEGILAEDILADEPYEYTDTEIDEPPPFVIYDSPDEVTTTEKSNEISWEDLVSGNINKSDDHVSVESLSEPEPQLPSEATNEIEITEPPLNAASLSDEDVSSTESSSEIQENSIQRGDQQIFDEDTSQDMDPSALDVFNRNRNDETDITMNEASAGSLSENSVSDFGSIRSVDIDKVATKIKDIADDLVNNRNNNVDNPYKLMKVNRKSSLAFVFDSTGSMWDDLVQLREGARLIMESMANREDNPIENYVLVPFHDPEIGEVTVTKDHNVFRDKLEDIHVHGGGDCPEMALGGIKEALKVSLPGSYLYVFTDATAADYKSVTTILDLVQRTQTQVVFVLTGYCGDKDSPGYRVYEEIAAASSGQVFNLNKTDVNQVLRFVKDTLDSRRVPLLSVSIPTGSNDEHNVLIDESLKEITVSVAGENPVINLTSPKGHTVVPPELTKVLDLNKIQVVNVVDPSPGKWKLGVGSDSEHSIRLTGLTDLRFTHGFSVSPTQKMEETSHRPLYGTNNYLLIQPSDPRVVHNTTKVEFIALDGKPLFHLDLSTNDSSTYSTKPFPPPHAFFNLAINGFDSEGNPFRRITPTAIQPQHPERPYITLKKEVQAFLHQPIILYCHVNSLVPVSVIWFKNKVPITEKQVYKQSTIALYHIADPTIESEGQYTCSTKNEAGKTSQRMMLSVTGPAPVLLENDDMNYLEDSSIVIPCVVESELEYTVNWSTLTEEGYKKPVVLDKDHIIEQDSLVIHNLKHTDAGVYLCTAKNKGGRTSVKTKLTVDIEPLEVTVTPAQKNYKEGESFLLTCTANKPSDIYWERRGYGPLPIWNGFEGLSQTNLSSNYHITSAHKDHEGVYNCIAKTKKELKYAQVNVKYVYEPVCDDIAGTEITEEKLTMTLKCKCHGEPVPYYTWTKNGEELENKPDFKFTISAQGDLTILNALEDDAGAYTCHARNEHGIKNRDVNLFIETPPKIVDNSQDTDLEINKDGYISCGISGIPKPVITIYKDGENIRNTSSTSVYPNGTLEIRQVQLNDEGTYHCKGINDLGEISKKISVHVTGLVEPVIEKGEPLKILKDGETLLVECSVLQGVPKPRIHWLHNGRKVDDDAISVSDHAITIDSVTVNDIGVYSCHAVNPAGEDSYEFRLNVLVPPIIQKGNSTIRTKQGGRIEVPCRTTSGNPTPHRYWKQNGKPLNNPLLIMSNKSLVLQNVLPVDAGSYSCHGENSAGFDVYEFTLDVLARPIIHKSESAITMKIGNALEVPCKLLQGNPKPTLQWKHNERYIQDTSLLRVDSVEVKDAGIYGCIAENSEGNDTYQFSLNILAPPIIDKSDAIVITKLGETFISPCRALEGNPTPEMYWERNDKRLDNETFIMFDQSLIIDSVSTDDEGLYRCHAKNTEGSDLYEFFLTVLAPPIIDKTVSSLTLREGEPLLADCWMKQGNPPANVQWEHNGHIVLETNILAIPSIAVKDQGEYNCFAENSEGSDFHKLIVNVLAPPNIENGESNITLKINDQLNVKCNVNGSPAPAIRWKYNNQVISEDMLLLVDAITVNNEGVYTCEADNSEGSDVYEFRLNVLAPPVIKKESSTLKVKSGETFNVPCEIIEGNPLPEIHWEMNSHILEDDTMIMPNKSIVFNIVNILDEGVYSCYAENSEGRDVFEFKLNVLVPPIVDKGNTTVTVKAGDKVEILCRAIQGNPAPRLFWKHNGRIIEDGIVEKSNQSLILPSVTVNDIGRYTCFADNEAGQDVYELVLKVLVPPTIESILHTNTSEVGSPKGRDTVVEGAVKILRCEAKGEPRPLVTWAKDGMPVAYNKYTYVNGSDIVVANARPVDAGVYECTAQNSAGLVTKQFNLLVLTPPRIAPLGPPMINAIEGQLVTLPCNVQANPPPKVTWLFNKLPIVTSDRLQIDDSNTLRFIANLTDSGIIECQAENPAGVTSQELMLLVFVPPTIEKADDEVVRITPGEDAILNCIAVGFPEPEIRWQYNGEPIEQNNPLFDVDESGVLTVLYSNIIRKRRSTEDGVEEDRRKNQHNVFICDAENEAGLSQKAFYLIIHEAPYILEDLKPEIALIEGEYFTIPCTAGGNPNPYITWYKNDILLPRDSSVDIYVDLYNSLIIKSSTPRSTGSYTCEASNTEGQDLKNYFVTVTSPPSMGNDKNGMYAPNDIAVREGESVRIECPVYRGTPAPTIYWLKNNQTIYPSSGLSLSDNSRFLTIYSAEKDATADYTCIATNIAGRDNFTINVNVLSPPKLLDDIITGNDKYNSLFSNNKGEQEIYANNDIPDANISAISNDVNDNDIFLLNGNNEISNELEKLIDQRPRIKQITAIAGDSVNISCLAEGNPVPKIQWRKGNDIFPVGPILRLPHLDERDSGIFTCTALNNVGSVQQKYDVRVLVPPKVIGRAEEDFEVLQGDKITLDCPISGIPTPIISWSLPVDFKDQKSNKESLTIQNIDSSFAGISLCTGTNLLGEVNKRFNITVREPPVIYNISKQVEVNEGDSYELICVAKGNPPPTLHWLHNGHLMKENLDQNKNESFASLELMLTNLKNRDSGEYICIAQNTAGKIEQKTTVNVLVAPTFLSDSGVPMSITKKDKPNHIEVLEGLPVTLSCMAIGSPVPDIYWFKDRQYLSFYDSAAYTTDSGQKLIFPHVEHWRSGNYSCVARNSAGERRQNFLLEVMVPPKFIDEQQDTSSERKLLKSGQTLVLNCPFESSPPPQIIWLHGESEIQEDSYVFLTDGNKTLTIEDVLVKDAGMYSCIAANVMGIKELTFNVEIQEPPGILKTEPTVTTKLFRPFVLKCDVTGTPKPTVKWYKDGTLVYNSPSRKTLTITPDGSRLLVSSAVLLDGGDYICSAENSAGIQQLSFAVNIAVTMEWAPWSKSTECSVSCGLGIMSRTRKCVFPVNVLESDANALHVIIDRSNCAGNKTQVEPCQLHPCQIDGQWSPWTAWTSCSESCGKSSTRRRYRKCDNPAPSLLGKECQGSDAQQEVCRMSPCPVNGKWSDWSEWAPCSATCGRGTSKRQRYCDSPAPQYNGANCEGIGVDLVACSQQPCPVRGGWSTWQDWSPCSVTCGSGTKARKRLCNNPTPQYRGSTCSGENLQIERCTRPACNGIKPKYVNVRMQGNINGRKLKKEMITSVSHHNDATQHLSTSVDNFSKDKESWFPYLTFLLSPVSWNTAYEKGKADNGFSLTSGKFKQQSQLEFATGEELVIKHVGKGVDPSGALTVDIEVEGSVPVIQKQATVTIESFHEEYVQTGPSSLYAHAESNININGKQVPYKWNQTVSYDTVQGTMPYLVEKMTFKDIDNVYDSTKDRMNYKMSTIIQKGNQANSCPSGFIHDPKRLHCQDVDECATQNNCHSTQVCENTFGSYNCFCRQGYASKGVGQRCMDVNECFQNKVLCSHNCINTPGSYKCDCARTGLVLGLDQHTCVSRETDSPYLKWDPYNKKSKVNDEYLSFERQKIETDNRCTIGFQMKSNVCQDVDECRLNPDICGEEQSCLNTKGSYYCIPTPCPDGYNRDRATSSCILLCNARNAICSEGAQVAQTLSYTTLSVKGPVNALRPLVELQVYDIQGKTLSRTSYNLMDQPPAESFEIRYIDGSNILYSKREMELEHVHRINIQSYSYADNSNDLLYTTKFIIYIYVFI